MKDVAEKIGTILTEPEERDAIHVAVAPAIAACELKPGQDVGFTVPGSTEVVGPCDNPIGIVDPFLKADVWKGQRFFIFLYPRTITSLRHDWTHPAFGKAYSPDKAASEKWMEEFAAKHFSHNDEYYSGFGRFYTAAEIIEYAKEFLLTGDRHVQQGSEGLRDDTVPQEFWTHFEAITGMKVADYHRDQVPFCCTC